MSAAATSGTLTRNTEPHQKCSSRNPPATGPTAAPAPASPAQMAMARARSWGGKTLVRIDSVDGMIRAAPTPMSARKAVSWPEELQKAAAVDPPPKIRSPAVSAPLRPKRSPMAPAVSSSPAKTRP